MQEPLEIRVLGPFEVLVGGRAGGRGRREAPGPAGDARAPARAGRRRSMRSSTASGERSCRRLRGTRCTITSRASAPRSERAPSSARPTATPSPRRRGRRGRVRGAARGRRARRCATATSPPRPTPWRRRTALWRGPALQGLTGTAWFDAEARRLESLHVDALEEQFEVALALGEHRELVPALRSALADNPFRERLWGQLMLALYRSGRQADALEIFQEARRVLSDELGLEPGPELRRLQEAILAQDAAIAALPAGRRRRGNLPAPATLVRRPRRRARRGRGAAARAPPRDAHRPAGRGQEPARGRGGALARTRVPRRDLDRRLRAGRRRGGRRRPSPRRRPRGPRQRPARPRRRPAFGMPARSSSSTPASTSSRRRRESRRRSWRSRPGCGSWRRAARRFTSPGEARIPVAPLVVAAPGTEGRSPAVELFLERARAARPGFEADGEAVALAAEIARRVDGLPLALELAAARVNVLGLAELVSILERRAALLRDSPASDPARAALQGLVDWSYDLLHGDEKTLLHQLAVHRGGASRDSLVAVAATHGLNEATVNYLLSALVDKSIVTVSFSGDTARYDMLDSVREYVLDRLAEDGSLGAVAGLSRRVLRSGWPRRRASGSAGRNGDGGRPGSTGTTTTSGPPSVTRGKRRTPPRRPASGRSAGTSRWTSASRRAGASSSSLSTRRRTTSRSGCGSSCSPPSATSQPRSSISAPRSRRASAPSSWRPPAGARRARAGPTDAGQHPRVLGGRRAGRGDGASRTGNARGGRGRLGRRGGRAHPGGHRGARR